MTTHISVILFKSNLVGIPENRNAGHKWDPSENLQRPETRDPRPYCNPIGILSKWKTAIKDPGRTLQKTENRGPGSYWNFRKTGTPVRPSENLKSWTRYRNGAQKVGLNGILEKLYNCKSTFVCALAQKVTKSRKQTLKNSNLISFNLIRTVSILKGHLKTTKIVVELNGLLW